MPAVPKVHVRAGAIAGRAIVHAGAAGLVVGLVELIRRGGRAPLASLAPVAIGLTVLGALALGVPLLVAAALVARTHVAEVWWADARVAGPTRIRAVVRVLLALKVCAGLWFGVYRLAVWSHGRFNAAGAAGVLIATVVTVMAIALISLAAVVEPPLSRWLGARAFVQRAVRGVPGVILLVLVGGGGFTGLILFTRKVAPAFDWRPVYMGLALLVAIAAATVANLAGRLRRTGAIAAGAIAILFAGAALGVVGGADAARQAVAGHGTSSLAALQALWKIGDRDGDGSPGWFGGGDCDDHDRGVNPRALEVAGNGKDDNCSGGDLPAGEVAFRAVAQPSATPAAPHRNVVIITIDAMRADHVGAYGYERATSPTIDALAARGARFTRAISPSPTTRRAIPALMTGRYASTIAWKPDGWPPVMQPKRHTVLGQTFKAAGYRTAAILCCTTLFDKTSGNVEGIDEIDASAAKLPGKPPHSGAHLADEAREWLVAHKDDPKPFFLWMHFLDAHNPYNQPPDLPKFGNTDPDRYDAEIAYCDAQIGKILAALEEIGQLDNTIVVVSADHGDEFGEHGNHFHGHSLYSELIDIPLVIAVPGATPQVVEGAVSLIDLGPTVLDLVGLTRPAGANGRSLAAAVLGTGPVPDRTVLAELIADRNITRNLRAALRGDWKLIWDLDANTYELYRASDDPGDRHDRFADEPAIAADLRAQLGAASDRELSLLPGEPSRDAKPKKPKK
jgi:arylsulfatase A-like enzyme